MENTTYPRRVVLVDSKLFKLLKEKEDVILVGRLKSEEIEKLEKEMVEIDEQIQKIEKGIKRWDLNNKAKEVTRKFNAVLAEMDAVKAEIRQRMKESVPKELPDKYDVLKKQKEEKENERNKLALKAQKYNDKIIPLTRKAMKGYLLDEFDDYDTIKIENGELVGTIFNHLVDFKTRFKKRN